MIYTKEDSANMAMASLNGLMYRLEHSMRVVKVSHASIRQAYYTKRSILLSEPCNMEKSMRDYLDQAILPQPTTTTREEKRKGGLRRKGDERFLIRSRRLLAATDKPNVCFRKPRNEDGLLETDF